MTGRMTGAGGVCVCVWVVVGGGGPGCGRRRGSGSWLPAAAVGAHEARLRTLLHSAHSGCDRLLLCRAPPCATAQHGGGAPAQGEGQRGPRAGGAAAAGAGVARGPGLMCQHPTLRCLLLPGLRMRTPTSSHCRPSRRRRRHSTQLLTASQPPCLPACPPATADAEVSETLARYDTNGDGIIDYAEFLRVRCARCARAVPAVAVPSGERAWGGGAVVAAGAAGWQRWARQARLPMPAPRGC